MVYPPCAHVCVCVIHCASHLQMMGGDSHHLPLDFSRIYPTPPSVESTDDKYEEGKGLGSAIGGALMDERGDKVEGVLIAVSQAERERERVKENKGKRVEGERGRERERVHIGIMQ